VKDLLLAYTPVVKACLWAAAFLPLLSFILSFVISERYAWVSSLLSAFLLLLTAICASIVFVELWHQHPASFSVVWFSIGGVQMTAGVLVNDLSVIMLFVVSVISFLVHLFSIGYMADDPAQKRYFGMLGLFTFSMLGIVLANSLLLIFVFWELVGFSSYMLIGHWQHKPSAGAAARKAFVLNRIGDAGFLIGLMIIWASLGSFNLDELEGLKSTAGTAAALCLFCGVIGKSAQFPLFTWLPDAMEGPTPVSALIHAATMVAAGVFLLARVHFIFTPEALAVVAVTGIITALAGSLAALVQNDIKKILAYSTISQLGLMVTAMGAGAPEAAMLHLFTHAFFKACLFLCAGSIIHSLHQAQHQAHVHFDVQDIRNLGGLRNKLPFTYRAVLLSGAALSGIPLFSGFLSKEAIFTALYSWKGDTLNGRWIIFALAFIVSLLTIIYMFRFTARIFFGKENATRTLDIAEPPPVMRAPIALMAAASLWFVVSWNPFNPVGWLFAGSADHYSGLTLFSIAWVLFGLALAFVLFRRKRPMHSEFLSQAFYIDKFSAWFVGSPVIAVSYVTNFIDRKIIDRSIHGLAYAHVLIAHLAGWFDHAIVDGTVNGVAATSRFIGAVTRSFQSGKIQLYVFWAIFTIIIFLIWSLIY
jgi:NADH-quinone oxidoreductase subunit L